MNSNVQRLVEDLERLLASSSNSEEVERRAQRALLAFVGRISLREAGYAPLEEILPIMKEGRVTLETMTFEGAARNLRYDLLRELDRTIAVILARRLPPLAL
jgi:hypothetical protein